MKALFVLNQFEVTREEIELIDSDFIYCVFNQKNLFEADGDCHFYSESFNVDEHGDIKTSLQLQKIKEVVIHGDELHYDQLRASLNCMGIFTYHYGTLKELYAV